MPVRKTRFLALTLSILFTLTNSTFGATFGAKLFVAPPLPSDFSLRSIDGKTISDESLRGKVVVLAFGASWLPLSRAQVQGLQKLADSYRGAGVEVFWVSTDSESPKSKNYASDDQLRVFANKFKLKVQVLRDPDGAVSKKFNVDQLPAVVLLNRQGEVSGAPLGGLDPEGNLVDQIGPKLDELL